MGICHLTSRIVSGNGFYEMSDGLQPNGNHHIHDGSADDIKKQMDQSCPLGIPFPAKSRDQGRHAGSNVAAQDNKEADPHIQKSLVSKQQDNSHSCRRALQYCSYCHACNKCQGMAVQGTHGIYHLRGFLQNTHGRGHGGKPHEQNAKAHQHLAGSLNPGLPGKHQHEDSCHNDHRRQLR